MKSSSGASRIRDRVAERQQLRRRTPTALDNAAKALRPFKSSLDEASARLGNLNAEFDRMMTYTGASCRIEDAKPDETRREVLSRRIRGGEWTHGMLWG